MKGSQAEIIELIIRMLEPFNREASPITADTDITRDLSSHSLAVMDLVMDLEEKFDISIPLNLVPEIQTVADLAATIHRIKEDA